MADEPAANKSQDLAAASAAATSPAPAVGTPVVDLNAVLAENKRLTDERTKLMEAAHTVRQQRDRFASQAKEAQRRLEESGDVNFGAAGPARPAARETVLEGRLAEIGFKMDHPDWNKPLDKDGKTVWNKMTEILFDDSRSGDFVGPSPEHTLNNIYREVQLQRALTTQRETAKPVSVRAQIAAQAEMSGQGANTPIPTIDIDDAGMTADKLLDEADKAGWLEGLIDPNDPPSSLRR